MTKKDSKKLSSGAIKMQDTRDAVESAIARSKGDKRITWEAAIARTHKKVGKWEGSESLNKRKRSAA
jgi:hypothetical protein